MNYKTLDEISARSSACFGIHWHRLPQCSFCPLGVRGSDCKTESDQNLKQKRIAKRLAAHAISGLNQCLGETLADSLGLDLKAILDLARDLKPDERTLVELIYGREESLRKTARRLNLHPEQVRRLQARALAKIKKALEQAS